MKDKTKKFAVGTIIAAIAGYLAGILTAPKSGKDTRADIKNTAVKAKKEAEKKLKALHSELDGLIAKARPLASKLQAGADKDLKIVIEKAKNAKEKARQLLSSIHEGDAADSDLKKAIDEANQAITHLKTFLAKNGPLNKDR